jgi:hypothetical protein
MDEWEEDGPLFTESDADLLIELFESGEVDNSNAIDAVVAIVVENLKMKIVGSYRMSHDLQSMVNNLTMKIPELGLKDFLS